MPISKLCKLPNIIKIVKLTNYFRSANNKCLLYLERDHKEIKVMMKAIILTMKMRQKINQLRNNKRMMKSQMQKINVIFCSMMKTKMTSFSKSLHRSTKKKRRVTSTINSQTVTLKITFQVSSICNNVLSKKLKRQLLFLKLFTSPILDLITSSFMNRHSLECLYMKQEEFF